MDESEKTPTTLVPIDIFDNVQTTMYKEAIEHQLPVDFVIVTRAADDSYSFGNLQNLIEYIHNANKQIKKLEK